MLFTPLRLLFLQHDHKCNPEGPAFAESYKEGIKIMLCFIQEVFKVNGLLTALDRFEFSFGFVFPQTESYLKYFAKSSVSLDFRDSLFLT